jgi:hypothetical protein
MGQCRDLCDFLRTQSGVALNHQDFSAFYRFVMINIQ